MMQPSRISAVSALLLVLVSCDAILGPHEFATGSFSVEISGSVEATREGVASFGTPDALRKSSTMGIHLQVPEPTDAMHISFTRVGSTRRPGVGTYSLGEQGSRGTDFEVYFFPGIPLLSETELRVHDLPGYSVQSGELRIDASESNHLRGSFRFRARSPFDAKRLLTVSGSFTTGGS